MSAEILSLPLPAYSPVATPIFPLAKMREADRLQGIDRYLAGIEALKSVGVCILPSQYEDEGRKKSPYYNIGKDYYDLPSTDGMEGPARLEAIIGIFPPKDSIDTWRDCVSWQGLSSIDVDIKKLMAANPEMTIKEATLRVFAQTGLLTKTAPPFWMSVSRSGGYHFTFLSISPDSGWNNPNKHAVNGTTIDIFSGQRPSSSHLIDWPTEGYIGVPLLDDPAAFIEERFGLAPDGQHWPMFQASLLAWKNDHLTLGRPGGHLLQWFIEKANKAPRVESKKEQTKGPARSSKSDFLDTDQGKIEVLHRIGELNKRAISVGEPELSPTWEENIWLLASSMAAHLMDVENPETQTLLLSYCRGGHEEQDSKRVLQNCRGSGRGHWPAEENADTSIRTLYSLANRAESALREPELAACRKRLEESGLLLFSSNKGNYAVDIGRVLRKSASGDAGNVEEFFLINKGLAHHKMHDQESLALAEFARLSNIKGDTNAIKMMKAADDYLCHPAKWDSIEFLPVGSGPYAQHPDDVSEPVEGRYRLIVPISAINEDDIIDNWADNPDVNDYIEAVRWFYPGDAPGFEWRLDWEASSFQNPHMPCSTSPLTIGPTKTGKNLIVAAVDSLFTFGCLKTSWSRVYTRFNTILLLKHRLHIDELFKITNQEQLATAKSEQSGEGRMLIEEKNGRTMEVVDRISRQLSANVDHTGLLSGGGDGRYAVARNLEPVLHTGNEQELRTRRLGSLLYDPANRRTDRFRKFQLALGSMFATRKCTDISFVPDTLIGREIRQSEKEDMSLDKVPHFLEWLVSAADDDEFVLDGDGQWLYHLPKVIQDGLYLQMSVRFVSKDVGDTRRVILTTSLICDLMKTIRNLDPNQKASLVRPLMKFPLTKFTDDTNQNNANSRLTHAIHKGKNLCELLKGDARTGGPDQNKKSLRIRRPEE